MFRQLELAFCPNKEWEKKGSNRAGGRDVVKTDGEMGYWGGWLASKRRGVRTVLGKGKV